MEKIHFIGIGGIGMSGLAQMYRHAGYEVSGSDRDSEKPANRPIFDALRAQGICIYPQDGSFLQGGRPDLIVYSSAVEEGNPDFEAAPDIKRLHRSLALQRAIEENGRAVTIAVSGSCGKSSVTAYLAETLLNLGENPGCLDGALVKRFREGVFAGNYRPGDGRYFVFEADESDKSLVNYSPDYALILNIGHDHYDRDELARVFARFLCRVRRGAVVSRSVYDAVRPYLENPPPIDVFSETPGGDGSDIAVTAYRIIEEPHRIYAGGRRKLSPSDEEKTGIASCLHACGFPLEDCRIMIRYPYAEFSGGHALALPAAGFHTALNALAIFSLLRMLGFPADGRICRALEHFGGVCRRFEKIGHTAAGALIYDDYAHNPEKILSCLRAAREYVSGRIFLVFQPHGYGPLGFMRESLYELLKPELRKNEFFLMLPVFYAGGTSSFTPTSEEVIAEYRERSGSDRFACLPDRTAMRKLLLSNARDNDLIVVMGARDNSLSLFARSLAADGE